MVLSIGQERTEEPIWSPRKRKYVPSESVAKNMQKGGIGQVHLFDDRNVKALIVKSTCMKFGKSGHEVEQQAP